MSSSRTHRKTPRPSAVRIFATMLAGATAICLSAGAGIQLQQLAGSPPASDASYSIWPDSLTPQTAADPETSRVTLGVRFSSSSPGQVESLQIYRTSKNSGKRVGKIWTAAGKLLTRVTLPATDRPGWQTVGLPSPLTIAADTNYVAAYVAPHGRYANTQHALSPSDPQVTKDLTAWQGVYTYGRGVPTRSWHDSNYLVDVVVNPDASGGGTAPATSTTTPAQPTSSAPTTQASSPAPTTTTTEPTSPAPTTTTTQPTSPAPTTTTTQPTSPAPTTGAGSGDFPNASNTGVPAGTTLTDYTGPLTITAAGTTIDRKRINGTLVIRASGVKVTNSIINGRLSSDGSGSSVTVADSEIRGGNQETFPSVSYNDITLQRVEVTGGQHSVQCSARCVVEDSWLHDQFIPAGSSGHVNAFISNGGSGFTLRHNTLYCSVQPTSADGGCTADMSLFGDFAPISDVTIVGNLFRANTTGASYCLHAGYNPSKPYGSNPTGVVVKNNVFERGSNNKCGIYGPVTSFYSSGSGNTWSGNTWNDGGTVPPG